jgi:hypothetical protein
LVDEDIAYLGETFASVQRRLKRLPIAAIALAGLRFGFRVLAAVRRKGATNVVAFFELALRVATDVSLVGAGVDEFTFAGGAFGHLKLLV